MMLNALSNEKKFYIECINVKKKKKSALGEKVK